MKKLLVNALAVLSVTIGLASYSSTANAVYVTTSGSNCVYNGLLGNVWCGFADVPHLDTIIHYTGNVISVTAKGTSTCWKPGTKWKIKVYAGAWTGYENDWWWESLGSFTLTYVLPYERGGVFSLNELPYDPRYFTNVRVDISGTSKSCIDSVSFISPYY